MFGVLAFYEADNGLGIIASLVMFVLAFQLSLGPIGFAHGVETCLNSTIGPLNGFLWTWAVATNFIGPGLMSSVGPSGTFIFFGSISFILIIVTLIFVKDTSFRYENISAHEIITKVLPDLADADKGFILQNIQGKKQKIFLSKKEKLELYTPVELRN